jgi:hypothetical protein
MKPGMAGLNKWFREGLLVSRLITKLAPYIKSYKGVRQGDLLSPILFNFVADCLTRMILQAQDSGLIVGLADHIIPHGVAVLNMPMTRLYVLNMI